MMAAYGSVAHQVTPAQRRAIAALLTARDVAAAARTAKVGERSLRRWLAEDAAFVAELDAAQRATLDTVVRRLTSLSLAATGVLAAAMHEGSMADKIRAANIALGRLLQLKELAQLEERLAAIEAAMAARRAE